MFRAILVTQWKWSRLVVLLATITGFALPVAALQRAAGAGTPAEFVGRMEAWAAGYALLAAAAGLLVALAAWQQDHAGRHVYALSLPVTRMRYSAMRFGAGAIFLAAPAIAFLIGSLVVAMSGAIPQGLHAYPVALTARFALATFVAFALFFAIASSTPQAAGVILGVIAALLFGQYLLAMMGGGDDVLEPILRFLFVRPGVFSVFTGRWMLVDV